MTKRYRRAYLFRFTVEGTGELPLDMLRYCYAWPASESDANVTHHTEERRQVTLYSVHADSCAPRWESFGWRVIDEREESEPGYTAATVD